MILYPVAKAILCTPLNVIKELVSHSFDPQQMGKVDSKPIQFFVKLMMTGGETLVIRANIYDTIESVHDQIEAKTTIPSTLQKLYYTGKRLERCQTIKECSIQNDACLQLVLRQDYVTHEYSILVSRVISTCRGKLTDSIMPLRRVISVAKKDMLVLFPLPSAFVRIYTSTAGRKKKIGDTVIKFFVDLLLKDLLAEGRLDECASLLLEICKHLREVSDEDPLYLLCRTHLRELLEKGNYRIKFVLGLNKITDIFPIFSDLAENLSRDLDRSTNTSSDIIDVRNFKAFSLVLCNYIHLLVGSALKFARIIVHDTFLKLLLKMEVFLVAVENFWSVESMYCECSQYLTILKELHWMSKFDKDDEEYFWSVLRKRKRSLFKLIVKATDRSTDHLWLLENKDATYGISRMHLVTMMIPERKIHDAEFLYEMLIVCYAELFNPQNSLFLACPNDPKRFYPNPDIKLEPFHLDCLNFTGKLIALALMYKVEVRVAFAHVFLMQLAGREISLEDVRNVDPYLCSWCEEVIDAEVIDSQILRNYFTGQIRRLGRNIRNWQRGKQLGRGSFGSVYEGLAADGFFFAVKELLLPDEGIVDQLEAEVTLLCQLTHPNIVKYFGTSKAESKLYVFLELVSKGSLEKVYKRFQLQDSHVSVYAKQILLGLNYLHKRSIVHRDIKCANVLVDENGSVKIADFGLAKVTELNALMQSSKGTPYWMAPEVVNRKRAGGYGLEADIWSFGCTVLEMLTKKPPYSDLEPMQVIFEIGKGHPPSLPNSLSDDSRDFIQQCLQVNPKDRPTAAKLLEHPFVNRSMLPGCSDSRLPFLTYLC
ncbi:hypothetical protein GH714_006392 [Hevea brasiliensis]|uniref:mitogen-activated protein kinase kinase kinase n=1 Tax=Hevea brasiliensis TaxID=3981 RepID=A0A6A6KYA7_HEVBR|nr:hypothetical protein GH714_006392 [Hevea brasiliensis]